MKHYTQWRLARCIPKTKIPSHLKSWLYDASSSTRRLRQESNGTLTVDILSQSWQKLTSSERVLLPRPERQWALVREVDLYCNGEAWMYARSVFPAITLSGNTKFIAHVLDSRPLGDILYRDPSLRRSEFEFACFQQDNTEYPLARTHLTSSPDPLWGRRSIFTLQNKPILLTEIFLPAMVQFCKTDTS